MLYVHIGSDKTGSSSIQWVLRKKGFAATGAERLRTSEEWGQIAFVHALNRASRRNVLAREELGRMARRANADPGRTWVLTNEILFRKGVAESLAEGLANVSVPIKVICYLRRPDAYVESSYKQRVKNGRIAPGPAAYLEAAREGLDFHGILGEYAERFGAGNIIVRPYERERFPEGNVVLDFLSLIGHDSAAGLVETDFNRNRSLSAVASELVGLVARTNEALHQRTLSHLNHSENKGLRRSRDVYTLAERRAIMEECAPNLERVRATFTPELASLFDTSDLAEGQADPYPSAEERLELTRAAADETIAALCRLGEAQAGEGEAAADAPEAPDRAERQRRRAARRAAAAASTEAAAEGAPVPRRRAVGRARRPGRVSPAAASPASAPPA